MNMQNLVLCLVVVVLLFYVRQFTEGYNIPAQNILVPLTTILILAYQAHNLGMKYARNILLALAVMFGLVMPNYSEAGSYTPMSYLSFVLSTLIFWAITSGLASVTGTLLA